MTVGVAVTLGVRTADPLWDADAACVELGVGVCDAVCVTVLLTVITCDAVCDCVALGVALVETWVAACDCVALEVPVNVADRVND